MISIDNYKKAMMNLPEEITEAEVNAERKTCTLIGVSGGEVTLTDVSDITSLYIRASGLKTGYAYTQDLSEEPNKVLLRAYNNGLISDSNTTDQLNTPETAFRKITAARYEEADPAQIKEKALELERKVRSADTSIQTVLSKVRADTFSSRVINSKGVDVSFTRNVFYAQVKVMANSICGPTDLECSVSASSLDNLDVKHLIARIKTSIRNQFKSGGFISGEYPVVLDRTVGVNIMMTAWQFFSGLKYSEGSTVLKGRFGQSIGSSALSVVDIPYHKATGYCFPFDCEGTQGTDTILVNKGKLTALMHNLSSSEQLGADPTGNAGRVALLTGNIPTDIIVTPKICCIKPGNRSAEDLISSLGDGVYITGSYDIFHSINIGSGDFAIPCRGIVIKDGKPHHSVTALTMCGNVMELFKNVVETADDLLIDEFLLKSYCVGSPSILLSKLQVNGK